jgi:hypothetical protein
MRINTQLDENHLDMKIIASGRQKTIQANIFATSLWAVAGLTVMLFSSSVQAQTWEAITEAEALRALVSDAVFEATLKGGAKAVTHYNPDGTGVLTAWGETFERTWEIKGADQICVTVGRKVDCLNVERNTEASNEYRAINVETGESLVFTVTAGAPTVVDSPTVDAGGPAKPSADEIAKSLANPNSPLASLTLKTQYTTFKGDLPNADDQDKFGLTFQPILPFPLDNGDKVIFRPAVPFSFDQPIFEPSKSDFSDESGLGDIGYDLIYAGSAEGGIIWGFGMVGSLPTATNGDLGSGLWTLGPETLIGKLDKNYVAVLLANHQWDFAGWGDGEISSTLVQPIVSYLPGGGWSVGSAPAITHNWETDDWTVPLNLNFSKTMTLGGRPWKFGLEFNYYVEQPDAFGPEFLVEFKITPVVENALANLFK